MANLLDTAAGWQDEAGASPPSYWQGEAYEFLDGYASPAISMTYIGTISAGDVVGLLLLVNSAATRGTSFRVQVNGDEVFTYDMGTVGSSEFTSAPLAPGDVVELIISTGPGFDAYDVDCSVRALGPQAFWTDFVGCVER